MFLPPRCMLRVAFNLLAVAEYWMKCEELSSNPWLNIN